MKRTPATPSERILRSREQANYDGALVLRFNAGDETAFAEIVSRYRSRMHTVAFSMLKNHADAEEIAQDALIRAHRALATFRGESSLSTWLHRIVLNLARNRYWYFFRRRQHATLSLDSAIGEGVGKTFVEFLVADTPSPLRETAAGEFSDLVAACMARLRAGPREILVLRNSKNRSYAEIGAELGISTGTVKSRIARAREMLRALLAEACPDFDPRSRISGWFETTRPAAGRSILLA